MQELSRADFQEVVGGGRVLVDFWAPWCGPCRVQAPILEELAQELPEVRFAKLNVDDEPEIASRLGVRSIPTLILFEEGAERQRWVGVRSKQALREALGA